jgi:hypothetical protein
LPPGEPFGARAIEAGDSLQLGYRYIGITHIGQRKFELPEYRPVFRFEAKLVDNVFSAAVLIVVDIEAIDHVIIEVEIVRTVCWVLTRNDVHNEHDFARILPASEHISVRVVRRWVQGDQWSFPVARRAGDRCCCRNGHQRGQKTSNTLIE